MRGREVITYYLLIYYLHVYFANIIFVNLFYYLVYANASSILLRQAASQDLDNLKFSINNGGKKKVFFNLFFISNFGIEDSYDCEKLFYKTFIS